MLLKVILGVVVGFIVWSILWVGSDAVLMSLLSWYGDHHKRFEEAVTTNQPFAVDSTVLIIGLIRSVIFSLIAGFVTAAIARENTISTLAVGLLLLAFGIFIQSVYWHYVPLWYHIPFLLLLIPMTFLGGKLRRQS